MTAARCRGVCLSYAGDKLGDGTGAQVQRIFGIFGLAAKLNFGYQRSAICTIEANPGDPFQTVDERSKFVSRVNDFFSLPSNRCSGNHHFELTPRPQVSAWLLRTLTLLNRALRLTGLSLLVPICNPYPSADVFSGVYEVAPRSLGVTDLRRPLSNHLQVDMHIRRAVAPPLLPDGSSYERHVSTAWYRRVAESISQATGKELSFRIHTDLSKQRALNVRDQEVTASTRELWQDIGAIGPSGDLDTPWEDLALAFSDVGVVEMAYDWDPLDAIQSMVQADILVGSRSSFSFVAGLLRIDNPTIFPVFWHQVPGHWFVVPDLPQSPDLALLRGRLADALA